MNDSVSLFDENIDTIWAGRSVQGPFNNKIDVNQFEDYYFTGEDIRLFIDGLYEPEYELDVSSFAYVIRQEKQPLYGFWSYNYDYMLLGSRIITGEFSIFVRNPRRMTELIEKAAAQRITDSGISYQFLPGTNPKTRRTISSLRDTFTSEEDDANVKKYWAYSQLDRITQDPHVKSVADTKNHIFSAHPPFNFVIVHGSEEVASSPLSARDDNRVVINDNLDRNLYSDVNQRSIRTGNNTSSFKTILQEVNLTNMTTAYSTGGMPVVENYQFVARDYYFTEADLAFVKNDIIEQLL